MLRSVKKLIKLGLLATFFSFLVACGGNKEQEAPIFTQLNEILADNDSSCKHALTEFGNDLILDKAHALQFEKVSIVDEEGQEKTVDIGNQLMLSGVIEYKDRPAYVRFDAYPIKNEQCVVSFQLAYQLDIPCIAAREEAFKKWHQIVALGEYTRYFVHMRKPSKKAFITSINQNLQCLVTIKDTQVVAID